MRRVWIVLVSATGVFVVAAVGFALTVAWWSSGKQRVDLRSAELAVVFYGADVDTTFVRARTALELVREGRVDRVLLVGGARPERGFYGSVALRERLSREAGFEQATWIADRTSYDTHTNLAALRAHLDAHPVEGTIALVSDDYHLFRIWAFLRDDPTLADRVAYVPSEEERGLMDHATRITWELAAWAFEIAPDPLRSLAIDVSRE